MKLAVLGLVPFILAGCSGRSEVPVMEGPVVMSEKGVAIKGWDTVSYFQGEPKKGDPSLRFAWKGVDWLFSSRGNLEKFKADPGAFAPQYGGHCSLAMSLGQVSSGSPESWSLDGGKLYFHNSGFTEFFFRRLPGRLPSADRHWKEACHGNERKAPKP